MKLPTLRGTRRLRTEIVPKTPHLSTEVFVWWICLIELVLLTAVPLIVFAYAGGDPGQVSAWFTGVFDAPDVLGALHRLAAPPAAFGLALFTVFAMLLIASLADVEARRSQRRHVHRWLVAHHPEDVPGDQVSLLVQGILREHGPMTSHAIRQRLAEGGSWGPAVVVSPYGLVNGVLRPKGQMPAWLADRKATWPWSLRENPYVPPAGAAARDEVEAAR